MPAALERTTAQQPLRAAPVATIQAPVQSQTDRIVEIDRMLSAPLTGTPADADRRSALRAERNALMALGNYSVQTDQAAQQATGNQSGQPSNEPVSQDVVDYAPLPPSNSQIVVAVDSQGRSGNLPFLEGMTPSERLHYFQALYLQNSQNINITRNSSFIRRRFRRGF
ncbi:MAG: hypothetical protein WCE51_04705 [Chthoniobacterales bacterium]